MALETVEGTAAEIGVVTYGDSIVSGRAMVPAGRECESDYDRGIEKAVQLREDLELDRKRGGQRKFPWQGGY